MSGRPEDAKTSAEVALDLLVYAPLGLALEARSLLPSLVERGRNQVTMAKMVGQFAVQQGQAEAAKRVGPLQEQVEGVLADLGLVARPGAPAPSASSPPPEPAAPAPVVEAAPEPEAAPSTGPALDPSDLAIPDYDSLAASQVVPRLRALSADELEAVRAYESAGRGRKTILNRIGQLQASG